MVCSLGRSEGGGRVPERFGEGGAAPRDAGTDGPGWDVEDLGDLGVIEVAEVAQDDGDPELLRDLGERGVDDEAGVDRVSGGDAPPAVRTGSGSDVDGNWPALPAAQLVDRGVGRDAVQPGREAATGRRSEWIPRATATVPPASRPARPRDARRSGGTPRGRGRRGGRAASRARTRSPDGGGERERGVAKLCHDASVTRGRPSRPSQPTRTSVTSSA